ncbi:MAG: hypothetical protein GYB66_04580 [Chloroflexi bacterium]|nr:hypothetical protein [Chloroflexota bacterium]
MSIASQPNTQVTTPHDPSSHVAGVRFQKLGKLYHFDFTDFPDLITGDHVIVETTRGLQMGQIIGFAPREDDKREYKPILRVATPRDMLLRQQWQSKEVEALINCREAASKNGQYREVKFVKAEYTFDGATLTIMYSTEDRFNPNPLRNQLKKKVQAANLEFRQIGPRDVARIMGGQGACGGPRCCSTFLTEFSPISIKMAKVQGIPLNPTEITGMCGRLRCCLIYEYEQYVEARKQLPKRNKTIGTPLGEGRVVDIFPLRDGVNVEIDDQRHFVAREDIIPLEEFRALKEKAEAGCSKNENGGCDCGARRPKSSSQDLNAALDLAHTATTTQPQTGSTDTSQDEETSEKSKRRSSRRRRRGGKKRKGSASENKAEQAGDQKESDTKSEQSSGKKKSNRRRRRSRRPRGDEPKDNNTE